jgi:hypothetical protein
MPVVTLWDDDGNELDARRVRVVGSDDVRELLRSDPGVVFASADVGTPLRWVGGPARFEFWKDNIQPHLVEPSVAGAGFRLEDFPGDLAYICSEWRLDDGSCVILAEAHH